MSLGFDPYYSWLGIPKEEQPPNHYRLLGIQLFEPNAEVVLNAADQRMAYLRTFQTGKHSAASQKLLNEVASAKKCLLTPAQRAAYDASLQQQRAFNQPIREVVAEQVLPPSAAPIAVGNALPPMPEITSASTLRSRTLASRKSLPQHRNLIIAISASVIAVLLIAVLVLRPKEKNSEKQIALQDQSTESSDTISQDKNKETQQPEELPSKKKELTSQPTTPQTTSTATEKNTALPSVAPKSPTETSGTSPTNTIASSPNASDDSPKPNMPDERRAWRYRRNGTNLHFIQVDASNWIEEQLTNPAHRFVEESRDSRYVTLYDSKRRMRLRIGDTRFETQTNSKYWSQRDPGSWLTGAEADSVVSTPRFNAIASQTPSVMPTKPTPPAPTPQPVEPAVPKRFQVPDSAAQQAKLEEIKSIFPELTSAKKPNEILDVAKKLRDAEAATRDDSAASYVFLDQARTLYAGQGQLQEASGIVDSLTMKFEIDEWKLRADTFAKCLDAAAPLQQRKQIIDAAFAFTKQACSADQPEPAEDVLVSISAVLAKIKLADVRLPMKERRDEINALKKSLVEISQLTEKLKANPDAPDANNRLGKLYCFGRNDWKNGLPYLAKSDDSKLSMAAKKDLASQTNKSELKAAADAWFDASHSGTAAEKSVIRSRSMSLYQQALDSLVGLDRKAAEIRITELMTGTKIIPPTIQVDSPDGVKIEVYSGLVGRASIGGKDVGVLMVVDPSKGVTPNQFKRVGDLTKLDPSRMEFHFVGAISLLTNTSPVLQIDKEYNFRDGKSVIELGTDFSTSRSGYSYSSRNGVTTRSYTAVMPRGVHSVAWRLSPSISEQHIFSLTDVTANTAPVTMYFTKEMLEKARRPAPRVETKLEFFLN